MNSLINSNINIITNLKSSNRNDINIISLILCELHFSSKYKRVVEYFYWAFLYLLCAERVEFISVGVGQIQIRHWIRFEFIKNDKMFSSLKNFQNTRLNYDLILKIFDEFDLKKLNDNQIIAIYRGEVRSYHLNLFKVLKKDLAASNFGFLYA